MGCQTTVLWRTMLSLSEYSSIPQSRGMSITLSSITTPTVPPSKLVMPWVGQCWAAYR